MTNFDFNKLNDYEKLFVVKSFTKGAMHATVIPLILMLLVNLSLDGQYGGTVAVSYIFLLFVLYERYGDNKYFSKKGFFYGIYAIFYLVIFLTIIVLVGTIA